MIKTVKGKVIAGTLAFGLVAGSGVAFGATDAGAKLQAWYDAKFGVTTTSVTNEVTKYGLGKANGLATEFNGLKTDATNSINTTGKAETAAATAKISEKSAEHIAAINQQKAAIAGHMAIQFDELTSYANGLINKAGSEGVRAATNDLTTHTQAKGTGALNTLTTDLGTAKGTAVEQLKAAIASAKSDLNGQLASEKTATVEEIKGLIDAKIIELRGEITRIKNELVKVQQDLITAKAIELENNAKAELQSVVDGI